MATSIAAVVMISGDGDTVALEGIAHQTVAADVVSTIDPAALDDISAQLDPSVTHIWLLDATTYARPDALEALLREMSRLDADVVGSKGLSASASGQLDSVGFSTDVLGETHRGFDSGELDQEQYDVVRDIGYVSAASMLIRREVLEKSAGFDGKLDPESASLDLCQRIRLAGGRIIVAPSSEVEVSDDFRRGTPFWQREAGRLRAILKAYSAVTLWWVLPVAFAVGIVDGFLSPLRRRFTLPGFLMAVGWNIIHLPETLQQRRSVARTVGDEELFRYQRRGSLRLSQVGASIASLFSSTPLARNVVTLVDTGEEALLRPNWVWPTSIVGIVFLGTRTLFGQGLPTTGYSMPLADSAWGMLRAYAGGWNAAGLGSPEPYRPGVALSALAQLLVFGNPEIGGWLLTFAAVLAGAAGMARLLERLGVGLGGRYSGALLYIVGPAAWTISQAGAWPTLMAAAVVPWVVYLGLRSRTGFLDNISGIAIMALLTAIGAGFSIPIIAVPTIILILLTVTDPQRGGFPMALGSLSAIAAIPLLLPWIGLVGSYDIVSRSGYNFYWSPNTWVVVAVGIGFLVVVIAGTRQAAKLAGWGGLLAAVGAVVSRNSHREVLGSEIGLEASFAAILVASFGIAIIAGATLMEQPRGLNWIRWLGGLMVVVLSVAVFPYVFLGRGGLPGYDYERLVRFTVTDAADPDQGSSRILLIGAPGSLPGDSRALTDELSFRVVSAPTPDISELWLPAERIGDTEMEATLKRVLDGDTIRGGSELAPFGVRWIIATSPNALTSRLRGQLDLGELGQAPDGAFEVEPWMSRAVDDRGEKWLFSLPDYQSPGDGGSMVRIAENADTRWGPGEFVQDVWAGVVSADDAETIIYEGSTVLRNLTWLSLMVAVLYLVIGVLGVKLRAVRDRGS